MNASLLLSRGQHFRIAAVVGKLVARLRDADFGNGEAVAFAAVHVGDHTRHVRAQRKDDKVEHGAVVFAGLRLGHFALERLAVHLRLRHVEPRIEPLGALLHVTHGVEVFIEFAAVVGAEPYREKSSRRQAPRLVRCGVCRAGRVGRPLRPRPPRRDGRKRCAAYLPPAKVRRRAEKANVVELFGWPVPELMESSSEAKRVYFDVTSAMS